MLIRDEMSRRFGDRATIDYVDLSDPAELGSRTALVAKATEGKLLYPLTVIDSEVVYDGAVSYPAILRAVEARLEATA